MIRKVHTQELLDLYLMDDGKTIAFENPTVEEYTDRIAKAGLFNRKDKTSVGDCWLRAHKWRNGVKSD